MTELFEPEIGQCTRENDWGDHAPPHGKWEKLFFAIMAVVDISNNANTFESDLFHAKAYYWGDCDCSDAGPEAGHKPGCPVAEPNFLYKPDGFAMWWYKRPGRGMSCGEIVTAEYLETIMKKCLESVL